MTIKEYLGGDHRDCDELFAKVEGNFKLAKTEFETMAAAYERHFALEETIFFPVFEEHTGTSHGPTQMMRSEHAQMRDLIEKMRTAIGKDDKAQFESIAETFIFLVQQHNSKEETILYTIGDRILGADAEEIVQTMQKH
ncbi:hypothetical protein AGMMS50229_05140 [Campylobacterota bacterium]|nr:hypothetical protein AGMMS50229_05140 [Campylobacterota bacterium]